ncbi:DUF421 domain-containing protein [Alicyclobacillus mengziensis]|uniref:DUF421 domain-containing protein n=1 Tax=Alicyclobacillus mengziensis TaxID=2931921 RepID=A0A9X7W0M2_9BACL|nr:DUF421 domain-containing protein [Alicyclobacillus mengziensis]QSO48277.1 DUF421 domain-containing protein [Alicyclobacillus mengziensis]
MPTTPEVLYQSVIAFAFLFLLARLLGKRQVAQLNFFDYIAGITIGNIAASWSLDEIRNLHAIISLVIWTGLSLLLSFVQRKSRRARLLLDGRPTVLIRNGNVLEDNLRKANLDLEEMMLLLRQKSAFKVADVEYAILETNGTLNVMKKTELEPLTPKDAGIQVLPEREPRVLIVDGHVIQASLERSGYSREWLLGEIMKQGATDFKDVFLAQVDSNGSLYVDLYRDQQKEPQIKEKPLVAASLKKIQADLENFALETRNQQAKASYTRTSQQLKQLLEDLSPYLRD